MHGTARKTLVAVLVALAAALAAASAPATSPEPAAPSAERAAGSRTGDLIVFAHGRRAPRSSLVALAARAGLPAVRPIPAIGAVAVSPRAGQAPAAARRSLLGERGVARVEFDRYLYARGIPNDPALSAHDSQAPGDDFFQWNLRREGFPSAWSRSKGRGARLAVIDTGVAGNHPDLEHRIAVARDLSPCGGLLEPVCDARHDTFGHGTHVAGLACGEGGNGYGIAGAAPRCKLISEKIANTASFSTATIASAITKATNDGADVISMSFGGGGASTAVKDAIDYAYGHDVVLVAAASNSHVTNQGTPASYLQPVGTGPQIDAGKGLVVTAADHGGGTAWRHPGYGTGISLAAYGGSSEATRGIFSTFPPNQTTIEQGSVLSGEPPCTDCRATFRGDDRFGYLEGTSMATPQVAGAAALIRSARPAMSNRRVLRILKRTADGSSFSDTLGWGILDAGRALRRATR
jgi:subtilisin family serine protease